MVVAINNTNRQNSDSNKKRMQQLEETLHQLSVKGHFTKTILIDDHGMLISESKDVIPLKNDVIGAMFSLIHAAVDRTVNNLNLEQKELITIQTKQGNFYTYDFQLEHYNRKMILVAYNEPSVSNKIQIERNDTNVDGNTISLELEEPNFKITLWRLLKVFFTAKLKILPDLENISRNMFIVKNYDKIFHKYAMNASKGISNTEEPKNHQNEENRIKSFHRTIREIQAIFQI